MRTNRALAVALAKAVRREGGCVDVERICPELARFKPNGDIEDAKPYFVIN